MKLSIGIVGLPNVGKSTLFHILTKQQITIANYPFATIDPNVGVVPVPDIRVTKLTELEKSKKTIPAVVEFYDIAGLVKGANKGEGLGNQFLANIRDCKAVVQVVRAFKQADIIHVEGAPDPVRDIGIINMELALKDLETVLKRFDKAESQSRTGDKQAKKDLELLGIVKAELEKGNFIAQYAKEPIVHEMQLLTAKKQLFLFNGTSEDVTDDMRNYVKSLGADYLIEDLAVEEDIGELIRKAYSILDLISFFTTGEDETRAWTIERGDKAPQAAGTIHTDFEKKFVRAEVIACDKLLEAGGWAKAKQKGWLRLEGKDYVMQDGDVVVIRHG